MNQSNGRYRIEPLRKDNYDTWVLQARAILRRIGLWDCVSGKATKPDYSQSEEIKQKWETDDQNAQSELILLISPSELKQIKKCTSAKDTWDTLNHIYQSKGPARKAALLKSLMLHKMVDNEDIREHLNKFADTVDKLSEMDININDDLLAIMMPYSLPASYENVRIAIESRDELPSPENLNIKIIEEDEARKKNAPLKLTSNEGAFMSKSNRGKKWHNNSKRFSQNKQES
jgi:hypothetical protein